MSYFKIWKVCQDYGLGIAALAVAKSNLDVFKASWTAEHGTVVPATRVGALPSAGDPYNAIGVHNTTPVPRAMVRVKPTSSAGVSIFVTPQTLTAIVRSVTKISTGSWHIALDERLRLFFGDPQPQQADNTVTRFCQPYGSGLGGGISNGLVVNCYDLQAGDFVLTDFEFSCGIYSYS